uniref:Uncharacterized protein n=1 Tax=Arundo donax TaxID=35708 RepID=A0A0A9EUV4_ARUDO
MAVVVVAAARGGKRVGEGGEDGARNAEAEREPEGAGEGEEGEAGWLVRELEAEMEWGGLR